jgi:glycosyltransferase involved in cell wall biosynthesis
MILQTWMYHADLLGLFMAKLCGIPFVFWNIRCAQMDMQHYPILTRIVLRILCWLSRVPEGVIVNSEAGRLAHSRMGYRPKVFEVIHNGFDLNHFRPDPFAKDWFVNEFDLPQNSIIIGHVARYDPMKDHKMFVSAAKKVRAKHPNAYFVFCGKDMDEHNQAIVQLIEQYGLQSSVRLLGLRQDISRVTAAFDIACSSSLGEGFSNTIGEAMASEVPCVVTDVGNSRRIVGGAGIVVPASDDEAFAEALSELIACGHMTRKRLGTLCRARIADLFDIDRVADRYKNLYLSCSSGVGFKQKAI